ncbi:MAG TPA: membrane protein insertase YidC [Alphaproteobacteria bacterium]|nr:membrane protein insertase YidC [Alphaproteobacteria bacterium]
MPDQKNLILAIVASILILVGFQFLFPPAPLPEEASQARREAEAPPGGAPEGVVDPTASPGRGGAADSVVTERLELTRPEAIAQSPRVRIDTPRLHGSLSLVGGRLDDLTLADYHETLAPDSPEIVLLSPRQSPNPYYADFGWVSGDQAIQTPGPDAEWTADAEVLTPDAPVTLTWTNAQGLTFERVIAVDEDYMFTVTQRVTNTTGEPLTLTPYGRVLRFGTPETLGFFILHEGPYGVFDGTLKEYGYDDIEDEGRIPFETTGGWLGFTDKYWMVALAPDQEATFDAQFVHQLEGNENRYYSTYSVEPMTVAPGATVEETTNLFAGAKEVRLIDAYQERYGITNFDLSIDFGWFYFLTKPFFYALNWLYALVGNFGVAILIFTVGIKLLFFPLANKSYKSMSKMKALQPEMLKLRERFGDDRQKMNMEMMALYKREKVNPASGCLPILLQIPVFFALYKVLFVTIEMRHAPFFGWIQDLSAPDPTTIFNLFGLIPWDPPQFLMIGIWPIIMGLTMWLQQKLNPAPADPVQQKVFMFLPIIFTFMLANFPAGLVIYWAWNNTLSVLQQWVIMKRMGVKVGGGTEKPDTPPPPPSSSRKKARAAEEPAAGEARNEPPAEAEGATAQAPAAVPAARRKSKTAAAKRGGSRRKG